MYIYLAARYSRYREMQDVARDLVEMGHVVTSRWIWGDHEVTDPLDTTNNDALAKEDFTNIISATWSIHFTDGALQVGRGRGGRHVEFGIALTQHKRIIIVGEQEHVFHYLQTPILEVYPNWESAKLALCNKVD